MQIEGEAESDSGRLILAGGAALLLAGLALAAHLGRLAESPAAGALPALDLIGPGKIGQLRALPLDSGGLPPAGAARLAAGALAQAPLSYEPFFVAAAEGFRGKNVSGNARDAGLLREAVRRNPRSREAHLLLLRHAIGAGSVGDAIGELAVLNRLTAGVADKLMPAVGMAIRSERQADDAIAGLAPHPELFAPFLRGFAEAPKPAALAVRLITRLPRSAMGDGEVRDLAVAELVKAQAFAEARAIWGGPSHGVSPVHSADFSDRRAGPPFNWKLAEDTTGVAERVPGGGVSIDYYGRVPGPLVSQLLTLAPGAWKVRIAYRTDGGAPGALGLQLLCAGAERPLFDQPLSGAAGTLQVLTVSVPVPSQGCKGQFLQVAGRVQESRAAQQAFVQRVEVLPGDSK